MRASVLLLALAAAVGLLFFPAVVLGGALWPKCGGSGYNLTAAYNDEVPYAITTFVTPNASLNIDCLAWDVRTLSVADGCSQEVIDSAHPFSIQLRAETPGRSYVWPIDQTVGGSVVQLTFGAPNVTRWVVEFVNRHPARCPMRLLLLIPVSMAAALPAKASTATPGLIMLAPATVFTNTDTLFGIKVQNFPLASDKARVRLLQGTQAGRTFALTRITDDALLTSFQISDPSISGWHLTFTITGSFALQYQRQGETSYTTIASLVTYGSNPAFFEITSGLGPDGQLLLDQETTITFYGTGLSSMPNGDQAKFVDQRTQLCEESAPAGGGVPLASDLGPRDVQNLTYTTWVFTITVAGQYRVCYKHGGSWQEVVLHSDLPQVPATTSPGLYPIPTDAVSRQGCPTAAPRANQPTHDTYLEIKLNTNIWNYQFRDALASLLCIKPEVIAVLDLGHYTYNRAECISASIDIQCNRYGKAELCSGEERKNYLLHLWTSRPVALTDLGVTGIDEKAAATVYAEEPPNTSLRPNNGAQVAVVVVLVLTAVGVLAMGIYAFFRHQRGHRFLQVQARDQPSEDEVNLDGRQKPSPQEV